MPLWTIELKQDDQVSFTDYNDVDVMYLDDSYLMEPSEVFTTSTDSMDERIGYKDERKGYNTLSWNNVLIQNVHYLSCYVHECNQIDCLRTKMILSTFGFKQSMIYEFVYCVS